MFQPVVPRTSVVLGWLFFCFGGIPLVLAQESPKTSHFEAYRHQLFVVESVDEVSSSKNSVGSGFAVMDSGFIATNYHVVSKAVVQKGSYRIRVVNVDGESFDAEIVAIDAIHDLALLRLVANEEGQEPIPLTEGLPIASRNAEMGEEMLALGNPLDVGLSVVPGTFNGRLEKFYRPWLHFSGALNPGMSGGPTINLDGEVVGVNVAGAGNSVGFLVPVADLRALLDAAKAGTAQSPSFDDQFGERVRFHQDALVNDLIDGDWSLHEFGPIKIPKAVRPYVDCSGETITEDVDTPWRRSVSDCRVGDRVYLDRRFDTGPVEMHFNLLESDSLNEFQFAELYSYESYFPFNRGSDEQFTSYECVDQWITMPKLGDQRFKANYCLRAYVDFPELYDVLFVARGLPRKTLGLSVHYTLAGVGRDAALRFHRHFLETPEWN